ncbi:MAG: hypothetical protein QM647_00665 [Asticcacaulis sp.]|uniref:hypothetical protein n=1 Tax=Asticcacaulis sp. TaxID=1872648 RepID=UPI0039E63FFA
MRSVRLQSVLCVIAGAGLVLTPVRAAAPVKQVVTGPVARYWVDTATSSGMNLGGGKPSMSSIMGMMGGGDNVHHGLYLRLGSSQAASGQAAADHLPPAGLSAGNDLPLRYTPGKVTDTYTPGETTESHEPPKGKILIFWGCGAHAPAGQPLVIDLAKITDPAQRQTMALSMFKPVPLDVVHPPSPSSAKTYGEWPNSQSTKDVKGSLAGAHTVKGNYSPQIDFTLSQAQDFMDPIDVTGNTTDASGATRLTWAAIPGAKGIVATAVGGGQQNGETVAVMWTSAQIQTGWMGAAPGYLTPNDIDQLLASKALLPGEATTCTVPAEVGQNVQGAIYGITAYGGETNFVYPPRPADPKVPWNIAWETKVRYRTSTGGMLGQDMAGMMGAQKGDTSQPQDGKKKKKGFGLGDMIKAGAGFP